MSKRVWRPLLDLKLRNCDGKAFQDFLADFCGRLWPGDFVPVRPHGNLGDGGMDGYRRSTGTLYQCYGARDGFVDRIGTVCLKVATDYATARSTTPGMRRWLFTHNLRDVPRPLVDAVLEVEALAKPHGVEVGFHGPDAFRSHLPDLDEDDLEDLIGVRVYSADEVERMPEAVNAIVRRVVAEMDARPPRDRRRNKPPVDKFDYNDIPDRWRSNLTRYLPHSPMVGAVLAAQPDGRVTLAMPDYMRLRYQTLGLEGLDAGAILTFMHEEMAGFISGHDGRYEAAMAVLASMFESCVIFEDRPPAAVTTPT